jgi:hypothetical protein
MHVAARLEKVGEVLNKELLFGLIELYRFEIPKNNR